MKKNAIILCMLFSLIPLASSCAGTVMSIKSTPEYIEGSIPHDITVSIFDGRTVKNIKASDGKFRSPHRATAGLYELLFFTKDNHYPEALVIKAGEKTKSLKIEPLRKMKDPEKGVLAGVVYKPVAGGKLEPHSGILQVFRGEKVTITGKEESYSATTDDKGVFMIELPEGEYDVASGDRKAGKAVVEPGRTVIKNIQKGIRLY